MKIFFCLKTFLPAHPAGTEVYVAALAKGLMLNGNEVAVIKPNYKSKEFTTYHYDGIKILEYPESPINDKDLQTGKKFPEGIASFEKILIRERPDVIHFHELSGSNGITIQHVRIAKQLKIKVYFTFHLITYVCKTGTLLYKGKKACNGVVDVKKCTICALQERGMDGLNATIIGNVGLALHRMGFDGSSKNGRLTSLLNYPAYIIRHRNILQEIFEISEKVFVLNSWFRDLLLKNNLPAEKIVIVPQALPDLNATKFMAAPHESPEKIRFVYVGRICKIKGLLFLLKSLSEIKMDNWELDIYGNVTEEAYYQKCLAVSKDNKSIQWKGIIPSKEVVNTLSQYDVLLFPTMVEEMAPLIIEEAFAAGIPIIATEVNATAQRIQQEVNGWLVKLEDTVMRHQLEEIMGNRQLIENAKKNIPAVLNFENVIQKHGEIYSKIYSEKPAVK